MTRQLGRLPLCSARLIQVHNIPTTYMYVYSTEDLKIGSHTAINPELKVFVSEMAYCCNNLVVQELALMMDAEGQVVDHHCHVVVLLSVLY